METQKLISINGSKCPELNKEQWARLTLLAEEIQNSLNIRVWVNGFTINFLNKEEDVVSPG